MIVNQIKPGFLGGKKEEITEVVDTCHNDDCTNPPKRWVWTNGQLFLGQTTDNCYKTRAGNTIYDT